MGAWILRAGLIHVLYKRNAWMVGVLASHWVKTAHNLTHTITRTDTHTHTLLYSNLGWEHLTPVCKVELRRVIYRLEEARFKWHLRIKLISHQCSALRLYFVIWNWSIAEEHLLMASFLVALFPLFTRDTDRWTNKPRDMRQSSPCEGSSWLSDRLGCKVL